MADRTPTTTDIIVDEISEWAPMHVYWLGAAERIVAALNAGGFDIVARTDPAVCPTCGSDDPSDRYAGEDGSRCPDPFHTPGAGQ